MLLYLLGPEADRWAALLKVSDDIRVFNRLFAYIEHVHLSPEGVIVEIHPRNDGRNVQFRINVLDADGAVVAQFEDASFRPIPTGAKRWKILANLIPGNYTVKIWIDNEIAYEAMLGLGDNLV